jgi:hypothetical protein
MSSRALEWAVDGWNATSQGRMVDEAGQPLGGHDVVREADRRCHGGLMILSESGNVKTSALEKYEKSRGENVLRS